MTRVLPENSRVVAAFAAIYIIWGSTYLFIRFAVETLPPFLMAGVRFVVAGGVLLLWVRRQGVGWPSLGEWRTATIIGAFLLLGANGGVSWAEQRVPSGLAALLVTTVPLWMVLLDWVRPGGIRPGKQVIVGLLIGFTGVALLIVPGELGDYHLDLFGAAVLLLAALSWATGSIYARQARLPASRLLATSMEMLAGGALLLLTGLFLGEGRSLSYGDISVRSLLALVYLIVFGSLVAFSAYVWLLKVSTPARVSTYAYVNPVVAVLLGWAFAGEPVTLRTLVAAAVIVLAVVLITTYRTRAARPQREVTSLSTKQLEPGDAEAEVRFGERRS